MKSRIEMAQRILKENGLYNGKIDGDAGPKTRAALERYNGVNTFLPLTRQITQTIQLGAHERKIDAGPIDGYWGQRTNAAFEMLQFLFAHGSLEPSWRPEERKILKSKQWPVQNSPEFQSFYGERGSQLITIDFPYEMKISWDQRMKARKVACHSKVADSLVRVLSKVKSIYGEREIDRLRLNNYGGCYNNRKMRGGNLWSMHAWGIALDFDPDRNRLKWGRDQAAFAHPDYYDWWKCWEEEGWLSLGQARNFDWMHVQAARLD